MSEGSWSTPSEGAQRPPDSSGWQSHGAAGRTGGAPPSGPQPGGWRSLPDMLRSRPAARRVLSVISVLLLLAGAGMFAYPFGTDIYSDLFLQPDLEKEFESPDFRQQYASRGASDGQPVTRLIIPSIGVDTMVVEGTSWKALRAGAGHYPNTPLPGEEGNVAIAGHRTTYGKPFNKLEQVGVGSEVKLETPMGVHTYHVVAAPGHAENPCQNGACWITHPSDWSVARPDMDGSMLTLTTCHPKGSAAQRLILRARLVGSVPHGDTAVRDPAASDTAADEGPAEAVGALTGAVSPLGG